MPLSESDTRAKLIDPAIHARGWTEDLIRREETAGAIEIVDGQPEDGAGPRGLHAPHQGQRGSPAGRRRAHRGEGRTPATERTGSNRRSSTLPASAERPVRLRHQRAPVRRVRPLTGMTTAPRPMAEFPRPDELRATVRGAQSGFSLDAPAARPLLTRYPGGEATRRYYQDAAIRAVLEKLARGEKRALLVARDRRRQDLHRGQPAQEDRRRGAASTRPLRLRPRRTAQPGPWRLPERFRRRRRRGLERQAQKNARILDRHVPDPRRGLGRRRRELPDD